MHVKKNDMVLVIAGNDKGKKGAVIDILPEKGKIKVQNVLLNIFLLPFFKNIVIWYIFFIMAKVYKRCVKYTWGLSKMRVKFFSY